MNTKNNLKGDLKEIYDRVMNTPTPKKKNPKQKNSNPPAQEQNQKSQVNSDHHSKVPNPQSQKSPDQPQAQQPITSFSFSAKHPNKKSNPTNSSQNKTAQATKITTNNIFPLFIVGGIIFAVVWGGIWALVFGLI